MRFYIFISYSLYLFLEGKYIFVQGGIQPETFLRLTMYKLDALFGNRY